MNLDLILSMPGLWLRMMKGGSVPPLWLAYAAGLMLAIAVAGVLVIYPILWVWQRVRVWRGGENA